jgi:polyprenyldihydroxybenzoate methyltransferase/3-demethylubiquinol 3-O-methyltransferase
MSTATAPLRALPRICGFRPLRPITQCRRHNTSAVDPSEISHFNALAADWWDPHGSSRLLHLMNPLRLRFLHSCLARSSSPTPKRYLDVGCGGGILAESLVRLKGTEEVVAIDPTPGVLKIARAHMRQDPKLQGRLWYLGTTIDGLDEALAAAEGEKDGMFDVVRVPPPPIKL